MAKPGTVPKFADSDVVNPPSGQNNVATPPLIYETRGFDFKEKPPRQYQNYLQRWIYRWLNWLKQTQESGTLALKLYHTTIPFVAPVSGGTLVGGAIHFNAKWCRTNNLIVMEPIPSGGIPGEITGTLSAPAQTPATTDLRLGLQAGNWPESFVKTHFSSNPIDAISDGIPVPSKIVIAAIASASSGDQLINSPQQPSPQGNVNDINRPVVSGTSGIFQNVAGFYSQVFQFMVDDIP